MLNRQPSRLVKHISILLIILIPASIFAVDCSESKIKGENDAAEQHSSTGWIVGGFASGVLLGLIGTGAVTGIAAFSNPQPKMVLSGDFNPDCFRNGYMKKAKKKYIWCA